MITRLEYTAASYWFIDDGVLYNACKKTQVSQPIFERGHETAPDTLVSYKDPSGGKLTDFQMSPSHIVTLNDKGEIFGLGESKYGNMTGSKAEVFNELHKIHTPAPVKKVFVGPGSTHILTTSGKIYGTGSCAKRQLGINQAHEKAKWTQPDGAEKMTFSDYNVSGVSHIAKTDAGLFYQWGTFLPTATANVETKTPFQRVAVPYALSVKKMIPTALPTGVASLGTTYAILDNGKVSTAETWKPFSSIDDISDVKESVHLAYFMKNDNKNMWVYPKWGGQSPKEVHISDALSEVGEFTVIGRHTHSKLSGAVLYFAHEGLPYAHYGAGNADKSVSTTLTKNVAMAVQKVFEYPPSVISTVMIGCN